MPEFNTNDVPVEAVGNYRFSCLQVNTDCHYAGTSPEIDKLFPDVCNGALPELTKTALEAVIGYCLPGAKDFVATDVKVSGESITVFGKRTEGCLRWNVVYKWERVN